MNIIIKEIKTMRKWVFTMMAAMLSAITASAKTLVAYYSYTNNVRTIVSDLLTQIDADVVRIEPAEKGLDYAANNYAIGSRLIQAIRDNPNNASSYPAIDPVNIDMSDYDMIVIATPLWWNNMAAPMQSFLFQYGKQMDGKHIGLIVSSASSGISSVVADAKRLIPNGLFVQSNLWIRSRETAQCHNMLAKWLTDIHYESISSGIQSTQNENKATVRMTADSVSVVGRFDHLSIYNASGQMVLHTSHPYTWHHFQEGCYIAQIKNGNERSTVKLHIR